MCPGCAGVTGKERLGAGGMVSALAACAGIVNCAIKFGGNTQ
jgi:hypothetical protein